MECYLLEHLAERDQLFYVIKALEETHAKIRANVEGGFHKNQG